MPSNTSSNKAVVPEAKGALDRFKYEVANELGVPLTDGYNGNLTSKQNGSVGGYMVKLVSPTVDAIENSDNPISAISALSTSIAINLLRQYHEWNSEQQN